MAYVLVNSSLSAPVRRETLHGRTYLVAPLASLPGDGVLAGSKGPLFYPAREVGANPAAWDHIPITAYHPTDPVTNEPTTANDPRVLERQGIGFLSKSRYDGKLRHEAWFDEGKTRQVDNRLPEHARILPRLTRGEPIEVSTGLYTDNEEAPAGAHSRGRPYTHIARNYKPDHMAVLPDQVGACSLADGCGVHVTNSRRTTPRRPLTVPTVNRAAGSGRAARPVANVAGPAELFLTLLHGATSAHLLHLGTRSFAAHKALDELYSALPGAVDALVEAWQGAHRTLAGPWPDGYRAPIDEPLDFVLSLGRYLSENRSTLGDDTEIQNLADEVAALLDAAAYKLRFLQ